MLRYIRSLIMAKKPPTDPLIVVLGATGTGKSQLAVDLALKYNGEIINGDAMQMYAGLPIITNKIPVEEQKCIPHHLLGVVGLGEETWRVGVFKKNASRIIKEIRDRGKLPILVGGTHYYTQSLLFDNELVGGPDHQDLSPDEINNRFPILNASTEEILVQLREVDPVMADRWHPKDRRHIRRSLEIYLTIGKQASQIYKEQKEKGESEEQKKWDESFFAKSTDSLQLRSSTLLFWVYAEDAILKTRLNARVDTMLQSGLLDEVKTMNNYLHEQELAGIDVDISRGIWVSIGVKEFQQYLEILKREASTEKDIVMAFQDALEQTKGGNRRYAKRQVRWIRSKLIAALLKAKALDNLYLLDGSDINQWTESVSSPAIQMTSDFLTGTEMQRPSSLSSAAKELLNTNVAEEFSSRVAFRQECTICNRIFVIEKEWLAHLDGWSHRRVIAKSIKRSKGVRPPLQEDQVSKEVETLLKG